MNFFIVAIILLILRPFPSAAEMIIGGDTIHKISEGDTLALISSKYGVNKKRIIKDNNIDEKKILKIGETLTLNTRKIVPRYMENGIIINIPDRMLYFFNNGSLESVFPVGLGMPSWRGITQWRTPTGNFKIISKRKNPTWHVPESMQWKMAMEGKPVKTIVPPGPDNPLGRFAIETSIPGVLIHETIWHTTVYQFRSHGCIRVMPENMEYLFEKVKINMTGEIIYEPVKVAITQDNRVFLEIHRDIYGKFKDMKAEVRRIINEKGVNDNIDWKKIDIMLKEYSGIAEDITL